ncbi:ASKHA domain-containing protein [Alphaproteobacteria bacterium]|nr:ASKHA domain-containing protein [Alphaproteobacteria bacterium]
MTEKDIKTTRKNLMPQTASIIFMPSGKRGIVQHGTSILDAARQLDVDIDSVCGGRAMCGKCQVQPTFGEFSKHQIISAQNNLSKPSKAELRYITKRGIKPERRLGCNTQIIGDVLIDIPEESQVNRQVIRKKAEPYEIEIDPAVKLFYVQVEEPNMYEPSGDFERLSRSLKEHYSDQLTKNSLITCDLSILRDLQKTLRKGLWHVTVAIHTSNKIIGIWPGEKDDLFGLAVDIGSTTLSAQLCNLKTGKIVGTAGTMNPQIRFGEDLMSRISYIMMNQGQHIKMTNEVRTAINYLATEATNETGCHPDQIMDVVLVGNPIMHHLLLGIDPTELGGAPFALATGMAINTTADQLDFYFHPSATVYILPCIAGHVGADTAAVILSNNPTLADEMTLIIDIGTNAEIILGNNHRAIACSSPTGPAFEGAQISCGQRAAPGAIEHVRIDRTTLEPMFQIIGCDLWSTNDTFEEKTKSIGISGICGSGIIEIIAEMYLAGIISEDGVIDGSLIKKTDRVFRDGRTYSYRLTDKIFVTQNDIRAIQLAKAALHASFQLLMDKIGINSVDNIVLAGAFGSYIDTKYAMVLGILPDCQLSKVFSVGNAAGTGARIALLNENSRREIENTVLKIEKIETAVEPMFQEHFINAMAIPHKTNSYERLRTIVTFPPQTKSIGMIGSKQRRRRRRVN